MFVRVAQRIFMTAVTAALIIVGSPATSRAEPFVLPGWDLLQTDPSTMFNGVNLKGVPVVTHDFTGVGVRNTFMTDTIVRRLDRVDAPSGVTGLVMEAMQFRSVNPVPMLGDFMFLTLQSARGGAASLGSMTINFGPEGTPHGSFSSSFDVRFDLRVGALDGPIFFSGQQNLFADGTWNHAPPLKAVRIIGVNVPAGGSGAGGFSLPPGFTRYTGETGAHHIVEPAVTPEPASLFLVSSGVVGILAGMRRRRTKKEGH